MSSSEEMPFLKNLRIECQMLWRELWYHLEHFVGRRRAFILWRWKKLWIRKKEFHSSLNSDYRILWYLTEEERQEYWHDLARRQIAHRRDLEEEDRKFANR
jgi:hypothetical protein